MAQMLDDLLQLCLQCLQQHLPLTDDDCCKDLKTAVQGKVSAMLDTTAEHILDTAKDNTGIFQDLSYSMIEYLVNYTKESRKASHTAVILGINNWASPAGRLSVKYQQGIDLLCRCDFSQLSMGELAEVCCSEVVQSTSSLKDAVVAAMAAKCKSGRGAPSTSLVESIPPTISEPCGKVLVGKWTSPKIVKDWRAKQDGWYWILASGAQGGRRTPDGMDGGYGAILSAYFCLKVGDQLQVGIGGKGGERQPKRDDWNGYGGGGGGGTYVCKLDAETKHEQSCDWGQRGEDAPLLVAGGGGGSGSRYAGENAELATSGSGGVVAGGEGGRQGAGGASHCASGGNGFFFEGERTCGGSLKSGALLQGRHQCWSKSGTGCNENGGFLGGGCGRILSGGGGGGYSGGGGGNMGCGGGGGGSFVCADAVKPEMKVGATGNGNVEIWLASGPPV